MSQRFTRIVLVCGGRGFIPGPEDYSTLASFLLPGTKLIHGACPTGADAWAAEFADGLGFILIEAFPADWDKHGNAAGPKRNQQMLNYILRENIPTTVLAFPGGRGTADMVKRAKSAGLYIVNTRP